MLARRLGRFRTTTPRPRASTSIRSTTPAACCIGATRRRPEMNAVKGSFVLGNRTYKWSVTINGSMGFGDTKKEAVKDARECVKRRKENEALLDNFNYVGSRHHY